MGVIIFVLLAVSIPVGIALLVFFLRYAGAKDDKDQHTVTYCDSLAARGFVTAAVEYRLGITAKIKNNTLIHID